MSYTTSSSITRKDLDKATFIFSIDNFAQAKNDNRSGQVLKSETFSIGASKFFLRVYPSGEKDSDAGFVSVFLKNASDHKVTVQYTMSIGNKEYRVESRVMKPGVGVGHTQFMNLSEVGQNVKVKADLILVKEEILDGLPRGLSLTDWQFMKKGDADNQQKMELRLVQKLEQKIEKKLEQKLELKLEQKLEQKLELKLEQKMEQKLEQKLEEKLNNKHSDLKRKIHDEFEDLKEDIKAPARAPECPICFEELRPPMQIIQCLKGHKLCEPCSQKPDIVSCPDGCKAGFMGRDFGMEAFILKQFQSREPADVLNAEHDRFEELMNLPAGSSGFQHHGRMKPTKKFSIFKSKNKGKSEADDPDFIPGQQEQEGDMQGGGDFMSDVRAVTKRIPKTLLSSLPTGVTVTRVRSGEQEEDVRIVKEVSSPMASQGTGEAKTELLCPLCSGTFLDLIMLETHAGDCDGTQLVSQPQPRRSSRGIMSLDDLGDLGL